ncbi:MAG: PHP domain-containing protein [Balneolaceae bacterium]|nr:PHP domain-containing protein [Balneolaceae bacterium]
MPAKRIIFPICIFLAGFFLPVQLFAQTQILVNEMYHIRSTSEREWSFYPEIANRDRLIIDFNSETNRSPVTLKLRQNDVKQRWAITLNDQQIGNLHADESDITAYFSIPEQTLRSGVNRLIIQQANTTPDDIQLGNVSLINRPVEEVLNEGRVSLNVSEKDSGNPIPARLTIVNHQKSLQTVGASSGNHIAVRPGVVYTGNGIAEFGLPEGVYTIYANRGMEFSVDSATVTIERGSEIVAALEIERQVFPTGFINSDTHTHTFTHSGHGDASIEERMITIAGEGIDFPIATDHNVHIDYEPVAIEMGLRHYFTPAVGNEVTTGIGHFNIFPTSADVPVPDYQPEDWDELFDNIYNTEGIRVVILNHGRDLHRGFRPLDRENFNPYTGRFRDGFNPRFNAMEVINSGAHQTDMMQLFRDWFAMLNHGLQVSPVAGSDAHDVTRYILGQSRTYIQSETTDPSSIDIQKAAEAVAAGRVSVGMGLYTEILVNGNYGPGDIVPASDSIHVEVTVQGPGWTTLETVELYRNGIKIDEIQIADDGIAGVKWRGSRTLDPLGHNSWITAIARGPGVEELYWPIGRPWQPDTPDWTPYVFGATGAVWLDEDGTGEKRSAHYYAAELVNQSEHTIATLLELLGPYDEAVAIQTAGILFPQVIDIPVSDEINHLIHESAPHVKSGFKKVIHFLTENAD